MVANKIHSVFCTYNQDYLLMIVFEQLFYATFRYLDNYKAWMKKCWSPLILKMSIWKFLMFWSFKVAAYYWRNVEDKFFESQSLYWSPILMKNSFLLDRRVIIYILAVTQLICVWWFKEAIGATTTYEFIISFFFSGIYKVSYHK